MNLTLQIPFRIVIFFITVHFLLVELNTSYRKRIKAKSVPALKLHDMAGQRQSSLQP
jgi:hypothetical protein